MWISMICRSFPKRLKRGFSHGFFSHMFRSQHRLRKLRTDGGLYGVGHFLQLTGHHQCYGSQSEQVHGGPLGTPGSEQPITTKTAGTGGPFQP